LRSSGRRIRQAGPFLHTPKVVARVQEVAGYLAVINCSLARFEFTYCDLDDRWCHISKPATQYHVVFNDGGVEAGGRCYCSIQNLPNRSGPKPIRETIHINGRPTVELDYGSLHIRMAYHSKGLSLARDPYNVADLLPEGHTLTEEGRGELRSLIKRVMVALPNSGNPDLSTAKNQQAATMTVQGILEEWYRTNPAQAQVRRAALPQQWTAAAIVGLLVDQNQEIGDLLFSGMGKRWQVVDGEIARRVMRHFADQGKPCLAVHDSFIVWSEDQEELRIVMTAKYKEVMMETYELPSPGPEPVIDVKSKRRVVPPVV
jgi:hypothetical protein